MITSKQDSQVPFREMSKGKLIEECKTLQRLLADSEQARSQRDVEFQEFVYSVSHDLSADLRAASGFSAFLLEEYQDQLDDNAKQYIDYIVNGVERMKNRLNGLATLSRVTTIESSFDMMNLNDVFADVLASVHDEIVMTGATVTADVLPTVNGDRGQLTQLLEQLIKNSLVFTDAAAPSVHVSAKRDATELTISVTDNGVGVKPEYNEKVFKIFHRIDCTRNQAGAGIGLAICRRIAQRHSGHIWLESRKGGGSIVRLSLPVSSIERKSNKRKPLSTNKSNQRV